MPSRFGRLRLLSLLYSLIAVSSIAQEIPKFPISRFNVEGNTLLSSAQVESLVQPFSGTEKDFGDVQRALEALEEGYRKEGYTTVSVLLPEQVLERGEVLLRVVEGRISKVDVTNNAFFDAANIRASLPGLREGTSPRVDDLSASLRVANENPAKKIALQLTPGDQEDEVIAKLKVTDEKLWKAGMTVDNTGTAQTGQNRLGLSYQHANLWNRDHVLTLQYQTSPGQHASDVKVYALAYRLPLYGMGDSLDLYTTDSNVNAGSIAVGPFDLAITGKGKSFGARYTWNLKRRGDYEHNVVFGLEEKKFENSIGVGALQLGNDLDIRPLSVQYSGKLAQPGSEFSFYGTYVHNLPGGGNGDQAAISKARAGADAEYQVVRGGLTLSRTLGADWQARLAVTAQWADKPLIPGEQFGVGGAASVRGFLEREVASDKGQQASLELYSPELCAGFSSAQRCRALAFYDLGSVYRIKPLPGEQAREHISSLGVGLRWAYTKDAAFQADYAKVQNPGGAVKRGDWRVHARFGYFF
ncbi:ShlB/FhaC/HecB family hemolysin secretion/activation protein [Denitratisoma oestradiolicum]|uniref:Uncharacterized protein n=1 Tax=Denitratisoma oestradiolicum TaxID=311182 RepID=A0A6S6XWP8_9PROT|nr:ShlB/FhaC/HecB family hemolysin secretion/activation protein [Denitratisoma oestradiolicum]TWO80279.1 hypothetical protein CBW56_10735 [Denitratisoma oestradiolicum]CAB1369374.1 conserved exported protein of unknown function [Denitratisoma oestradiolicum]